ncbi:MAG: biotin synthase BioB, partial [Candidatus Latescibacteria bacterium]|nr:biotin synthase BioB [Candidatus Latescibacterota bacterium]
STVPLNFLYPVPGTPMAEQADLTPEICLKIIAMFRLVMPKVNLAVCGGREYNLQDRQEDLFKAGVSHLLVGHYLTTSGRDADDDKRLVAGQGLTIKGPQDQSAPHPATLPASDSHRQQNLPVMR